jgi:alpha-mannosidase
MKTYLICCALTVLALTCAKGAEGSERRGVVFQIGKPDRAFTEFARERNPGTRVVFRVGQSSPSRDWYAYQPGSFDDLIGRSTREKDWAQVHPSPEGEPGHDSISVPFQVDFTLPSIPSGAFTLHLDAIFRYQRPAAPWYIVTINGHTGKYRLRPRPAPELWWPVGPAVDIQFVGYESVDMPIPSVYFKKGINHLTVRCEGGYGIYYDDLSLAYEAGANFPKVISSKVEPTILYRRYGQSLVEVANVWVRTSQPLGKSALTVQVGTERFRKEVEQSEFGDVEVGLELPAQEHAFPVKVYLKGRNDPIYRGSFEPRRRWKIYAMPREQADFGYDEVPARTLEWENRYIDKVLEIMKKFPSYSFTLDASANLESYLATRDEAQAKQVLEYLRNGRFGLNALYENFFTGLANPEELIHMVDYAQVAGRRSGFVVDSASQTDEPSVTWAFPQFLAEAGIKYYADASDPIRGPFNGIGLLNLHSPFYWEGPNGAKILTWSNVAYLQIKDLSWEGWNLAAANAGKYQPSLFGLEHSLPLFLSLYDRQDYPFDAILLFGLHDDEDPLRHYGEADIMQMWNDEYAYPQLIPATQREYFQYITDHFASKIHTYRGDGGAYWEDEAGADARVAAMNRDSQIRVLAAEKLESVANWLQPMLRFAYAPFQDAWKNIMLADCYVWSDSNSFARPYSDRTRHGEAAHRAWAEAAFQQTWDLRLTAMDQVAELIKADGPGAVVFNPESWSRSGFFHFELEDHQALQDPVSEKTIPCASIRYLNGYHEARCWAANVPALGYKFYDIVKGEIDAGKPESLTNAAAPIDSKFYTLQLDPHTGAVAHLIDKESGQDLVNTKSGNEVNEYLYVTGGDEKNGENRLLAADPTLPLPELVVNRQTLVEAPTVRAFPWGTLIMVHASALNTPEIVSTITLNDEQKIVSFDNEVEKTATLHKEGVYFAFPFAVDSPRIEYQGATAWVDPMRDLLPGANRQWFTTQGGVRISGTNQSISWVSVDAPLITLQDINRALWPTSLDIRNGNLFSYVMNNYWNEDAPAQQGGHFRFRYALTSGQKSSPVTSVYLSLEGRSPLLALPHEHKEWKQILPVEGSGFLESSPPGIVVLTIRPGLDEKGFLLRVHNSTSQEVTAHLQFNHTHMKDAYLSSLLGDEVGRVSWSDHDVYFPMRRFDLKTIAVHLLQDGH